MIKAIMNAFATIGKGVFALAVLFALFMTTIIILLVQILVRL